MSEYNASGALATDKWLSGISSEHAAASNNSGGSLVAIAGVQGSCRRKPLPSFASLVGGELAKQLAEKHGVHAPNTVQAEAIPAALAGKDVMTIAQTGSGKTLTFLLPMLAKISTAAARSAPATIKAVVIAPNNVLAEQHRAVAASLVAPLAETGLWCTTLHGFIARVASDTAAAAAAPLASLPHGISTSSRPRPLPSLLAQLEVVAIDEVDAVLCKTAHEVGLSNDGAALLAALRSAANPSLQYLLAAAVLTEAHEKTLNATFPGAVKVATGVSGASVG